MNVVGKTSFQNRDTGAPQFRDILASFTTSCRMASVDGCSGHMTFENALIAGTSQFRDEPRILTVKSDRVAFRTDFGNRDKKIPAVATCNVCGYHGSYDNTVLAELEERVRGELHIPRPD